MQTKKAEQTGWILFHDLAYTKNSLEIFAEQVRCAGAKTYRVTYPCEGELPDAYKNVQASDFIRAARTQTLHAMEECDEIFVMGHGMGALLALQMAEELPVRGVILCAPTLALPLKYRWFARLLARFTPYQSHGDKRGELGEDAREKGVPTAALAIAAELSARVLSDIASVEAAVRFIVPETDIWSPPEAADRLAAAMLRAKVIRVPGTHQCLTGEAGNKLISLGTEMTRRVQGKENET